MKIQLEIVDSTNNWAKRNLSRFGGHPTIVISAKEQTSGRGRYGASWVSPHGDNLYITIVQKVAPELEILDYPQACAIAIADFLSDYEIESTIKWPNDILVFGKKICGILIEIAHHHQEQYVIMGIGLNCYLDVASHRRISKEATCMTSELKRPVYVLEIEEKVTARVEQTIAAFVKDAKKMRQKYAAAISWMIGKPIVYKTHNDCEEGTIVDFLDNGCLLIEKKNGSQEEIASCESTI